MSGLTQAWAVRNSEIEAMSFPETLPDLLKAAAERWPQAEALNFFQRGQVMNYACLHATVRRLASGLQKIGVRHGDHVGVMLPNRIEFPISWLALAEIGAVMVPMVLGATAREIEFCIKDASVRYLIVEAGLFEVRELKFGDPGLPPVANTIVVGGDETAEGQRYEKLVAEGDANFLPQRSPVRDDLLSIQYTSGTTGLPKGVMLTHRYWVLCGVVPVEFFGIPFKAMLATAPFFYMDAQWMLCATMYCGGRLNVAERPSISKFVDQLYAQRGEITWLVDQCLKAPARPEEKAAGVKLFLGYHQSLRDIEQAEARFDAPVREIYGSTEVGFGTAVPYDITDPAILGTCGIPAPFRRLRVVRADGTDAADNEPGELLIAGDGIFLGYYNRPEANAELLVDGWFHTGDLFIRDGKGYYSVVGRLKDMVRRSGENISAIEVESVLRDMPEIEEAAVVPVPDPEREQEVKAYVKMMPGVIVPSPDAIIAHCRKHLAPFKVPRYLHFVDTLPMTVSEKVAKKVLIAGVTDLRIGAWDMKTGVKL